MGKQKITGYILIFLGIYLLSLILFPAKQEQQQSPTGLNGMEVKPTRNDFPIGDTVKLQFSNTSTGSLLLLRQTCPLQPLKTLKGTEEKTVKTSYSCQDDPVSIAPGATYVLSFDKWNTQLFDTEGEYKITAQIKSDKEEKTVDTTVRIRQSIWIGNIWDTLFYRPIYNTLILLTTVFPNHDLGWSIILLTLLIRLILLIPNQRALEQQKKMQKLQPKIAEIQKRYEGDQQKIGEETLKLWKEHKVNPFGSCLPLLLQLPFLIALYYAISNGLDVGSTYFLYEGLKHVNIEAINAHFLGILDLAHPNVIVLPIIVGILQFIQMKLSLSIAKKKKEEQYNKKEEKSSDPNAMMGKTMTYIFPVLIAFMTAGFPAGVGLYWGVSTIFGIAQQIWVNREKTMG